MQTLLWGVYQLAMGAALLLSGPILLVRRGRHYLPTLPGRLGRTPEPSADAPAPPGGGRGGLWIHAVSVGEVGVAATLARALPPGLPLVVTTVTPTGQARARALFAGRAAVAYLPFELGFALRRFFDRYAPAALVLAEGDLWPLLLREAGRRRLPVAVANGRMSDRSFRRMRRLRPLLSPLLSGVDRFGVQTAGDREKLLALGVPAGRIAVTGNLKYEAPEPARSPALEEEVRRLAAGRPVLLAGSTMAGEEEAVLDALSHLNTRLADRLDTPALLVLAPRHPERWDAVERLALARGLAAVRRSRLGGAAGAGAERRPDVLLLDSLGELAGLYALAAAAFVGGTLVPTGGHNPLEPARFGVPTAVGPSMENFRDMAAEFDGALAWRRVRDGRELGEAWASWLAEPAAARQVGERAARLVEASRGALDRTLALLAPALAAAQDGALGSDSLLGTSGLAARAPEPAPERERAGARERR
jgi:3-deoxy-D-manno-octulosonic-acid transferase